MNIVEVLKTLTKETLDSMDLSNIVSGTVVGVNPIEIELDPKTRLTNDFFVLTKNVKDYDVEIGASGGEVETYTIYNHLKKGDNVLMLQESGGQNYIVLDKI